MPKALSLMLDLIYTFPCYIIKSCCKALLFASLLFSCPWLYAQSPNISYQTPQAYFINTTISPLTPKNTGGAVPPNNYAQVTSFAGSGTLSYADGAGTAASFDHPIRSVEDAAGNLYVADRDNGVIRKVTASGVVTTYAVGFNQPNGVTISSNGYLYVSSAANNSIMQVKTDGTVSVFAGNGGTSYIDGTGTAAGFHYPYGITIDVNGNLYVADSQHSVIRKITIPGAVVTTFAGSGIASFADGTGRLASFNLVDNVYYDASGVFYCGDTFNNRIRKITLTGTVTTIAGSGARGYQDGPAASATFSNPGTTATDAAGNIYVADAGNFVIRKIDKNGIVSTLAGTGTFGSVDGIGKAASFGNFYGLNVDPSGIMYVTDFGNSKIRKISLTGYTIDKALPPGLTFDPTTGIITGTPTTTWPSTDYTVTAYNLSGSSSALVNITVKAVSAIHLATLSDKTICSADFAPDVTGGAGSYTITSSNTSVATIVNGNIHIVAPGTTIITVTDGVTSQSQSLTVDKPIVSTINIDPSFISGCDGMTYTYTATVTGEGSSPTYQWYVNGQPSGTNSNKFTSNALKTGDVINCTLTNTTDCTTGPVTSGNASLKADPYVTPDISIQSSATGIVAAGTVITFTATATNAGSNPIYQWQVNNVDVGMNSPTYSSKCFNNGDVVACVLTNQGGACLTTTAAASNIITVNTTSGIATVTINASATTIYSGQAVTFTVTGVSIGSSPVYQWKINNKDVGSNSSIYTTNALKDGDTVTCVLTDNGCTTQITGNSIAMTVLLPPTITIPTAFTPNNDGINDQWNIEALAGYPNCMVNIFTRYGSMIFHSKGYSQPWDGTFKGNKLAPGTYYYLIDLGDNSPKLSGYVTLIR